MSLLFLLSSSCPSGRQADCDPLCGAANSIKFEIFKREGFEA